MGDKSKRLGIWAVNCGEMTRKYTRNYCKIRFILRLVYRGPFQQDPRV